MALVVCPECGREKISDKAVACPDCGFPIAEHFKERVETKTEPKIEPLYEKKYVLEFSYGILNYSKNEEEIGGIRQSYSDMSNLEAKKFFIDYVNLIKNNKELNVFESWIPENIEKHIDNSISFAITNLMNQGIEDIDYYEFKKIMTGMPKYYNYAENYDSKIKTGINRVKDGINALEYEKQIMRSGRSQWQSAGFGVRAAISAKIQASLLNAGQEFIREIGDSIQDNADNKKINSVVNSILSSEDIIRELICIVYYACFNTYYTFIDILHKKGILVYTDTDSEEYRKYSRMLTNYIERDPYNYDQIFNVIKRMFNACPHSPVIYETLISISAFDVEEILSASKKFGVFNDIFYRNNIDEILLALLDDLDDSEDSEDKKDMEDLDYIDSELDDIELTCNCLIKLDPLAGLLTLSEEYILAAVKATREANKEERALLETERDLKNKEEELRLLIEKNHSKGIIATVPSFEESEEVLFSKLLKDDGNAYYAVFITTNRVILSDDNALLHSKFLVNNKIKYFYDVQKIIDGTDHHPDGEWTSYGFGKYILRIRFTRTSSVDICFISQEDLDKAFASLKYNTYSIDPNALCSSIVQVDGVYKDAQPVGTLSIYVDRIIFVPRVNDEYNIYTIMLDEIIKVKSEKYKDYFSANPDTYYYRLIIRVIGKIKSVSFEMENDGHLWAKKIDQLRSNTIESVEIKEGTSGYITKIKEKCDEYLDNLYGNRYERFKVTDKLRVGLGIPNEEITFLGFDNTIFRNGKSGFAITEKGIYCRITYDKTYFISYGEYRKVSELKESEYKTGVKADGRDITYAESDYCDLLMKLMQDILIIVKNEYVENAQNDTEKDLIDNNKNECTEDKNNITDSGVVLLTTNIDLKTICEEFLKQISEEQGDFEVTDKLRRGLGIADSETIYLGHDDTVFKTGKNGFAITNKAFYCRTILGKTEITLIHDLKDTAEIKWDEDTPTTICINGKAIVYYTGANKELKGKIVDLIRTIVQL
ncbi:MAG: zinc ribbon domain-containing protein [Lachnospiraceae bacterium]|nr:zinc ribbon domain-containing protein [Lachnospiraceae bacterium]